VSQFVSVIIVARIVALHESQEFTTGAWRAEGMWRNGCDLQWQPTGNLCRVLAQWDLAAADLRCLWTDVFQVLRSEK
jgi:hypothetical protein